MSESKKSGISRRQALQRLGLGVVAAYVGPSFTTLSMAQAASGNGNGNGKDKDGSSEPSEPSNPTPPTPPSAPSSPTAPSGTAETGANLPSTPSGAQTATCRNRPQPSGNDFTISRRDYEAAQAAVQSGHAQPLDAVWPNIANQYQGQLIGIEFTGSGAGARYQFRAISPAGRLETIVVSASSGLIETIVGC